MALAEACCHAWQQTSIVLYVQYIPPSSTYSPLVIGSRRGPRLPLPLSACGIDCIQDPFCFGGPQGAGGGEGYL